MPTWLCLGLSLSLLSSACFPATFSETALNNAAIWQKEPFHVETADAAREEVRARPPYHRFFQMQPMSDMNVFYTCFLARHRFEIRWLQDHALFVLIRQKLSQGTRRITLVSLGSSTGEELARHFYAIVNALLKAGEDPEQWSLNIHGLEREAELVAETLQRLSGRHPWVGYSAQATRVDIRFARQILQTLNRYASLALESIHIHPMDYTDIPKLDAFRDADIFFANRTLYDNGAALVKRVHTWLYLRHKAYLVSSVPIEPDRQRVFFARPTLGPFHDYHYAFPQKPTTRFLRSHA